MTDCPFCSQAINLSTKAKASIKALAPGKRVRMKCPSCSKMLSIDQSFEAHKANGPPGNQSSRRSRGSKEKAWVKPPPPPDISWLTDGTKDDSGLASDDDATLALILVPEEQGREAIVEAVEKIGYRAETIDSASAAMEKMAFTKYAMVILHSRFDAAAGINNSKFHQYMQSKRMDTRRFIFYVLIGPEFQSLYELQALVFSANIVVNDREIPKLDLILMNKIPEYEQLFGLIIEEIRIHGKNL